MNRLPKARSEGIVSQDLDKEVLIYDRKTNKSFHLNETSSIVYQACDGKTSFQDLQARHQLSDDVIFMALDQLCNENLIVSEVDYASPFEAMTRREVIKKVGFASMVVLPVISVLVVPTSVNASSTCLTDGQSDCRVTPCCPGLLCAGGFPTGTCFPGSTPP